MTRTTIISTAFATTVVFVTLAVAHRHLELTDDLGEWNAGMLIFFDDGQRPEYVPWTDVQHVDLNTEAAPIRPGL